MFATHGCGPQSLVPGCDPRSDSTPGIAKTRGYIWGAWLGMKGRTVLDCFHSACSKQDLRYCRLATSSRKIKTPNGRGLNPSSRAYNWFLVLCLKSPAINHSMSRKVSQNNIITLFPINVKLMNTFVLSRSIIIYTTHSQSKPSHQTIGLNGVSSIATIASDRQEGYIVSSSQKDRQCNKRKFHGAWAASSSIVV